LRREGMKEESEEAWCGRADGFWPLVAFGLWRSGGMADELDRTDWSQHP
jgi:hypothetical protein